MMGAVRVQVGTLAYELTTPNPVGMTVDQAKNYVAGLNDGGETNYD